MLFALRTAHTTGRNAVASTELSGELDSEPEQKSLAAADVSQRLLIRCTKELIAQPEPAAQLCGGA